MSELTWLGERMKEVDWEALMRAAEQTISAAAAAVLWTGDDSHGVLAHVAGATVEKMAGTRAGYTMACQEGYGDKMLSPDLWSDFEVAALPAAATPAWAESISAALREAVADRGRTSHPDAAVRVRAMRGVNRSHALWVCSLWGQDLLPLNLIEYGAGLVSCTALPPRL